MQNNTNFLNESANNLQTKVCFICGDRHPVKINKMVDKFFIVMTCTKENVKLGGPSVDPENFVFKEKHILK